MSIHTVNALSISKIGDLLIEQLGEDAAQYTFPEDFEKAIVDIGFSALVFSGESAPRDLIVIGNALSSIFYDTDYVARTNYKSVSFIGEPQTIPSHAFRGQKNLETVNLKDSIKNINSWAFSAATIQSIHIPEGIISCGERAFSETNAPQIVFPDSDIECTIYNYCFDSAVCDYFYGGNITTKSGNEGGFRYARIDRIVLPRLRSIPNAYGSQAAYGFFYGAQYVRQIELGSIGNPTSIGTKNFGNCTQNDLTITVYNIAQNIDTILNNIRDGATNATIVIKAATDTVYNGASYSAGDTILTSVPVSESE